jgi:molybdopterin-containing oxidoreductase family molybdopterin binding subunit
MHTEWAIDLLHHVVGAVNVPGGATTVSVECRGHVATGRPYMAVAACPDGFLRTAGQWVSSLGGPWPLREPQKPHHSDLSDLFVCALHTPIMSAVDRDETWKKFGISTDYDVLINCASNAAMNSCNPKDREKFYKRIPFVVDIDIFPNEFNEGFADIVLPDTCYLESSDWAGMQYFFHTQPPGLEHPWCFHITQKVVEPMYSRRQAAQVVIDILQRMGLGPKINNYYNTMLRLDDSRKLKPTDKIVWEELCDKAVTQHFGAQYDWEWFKKNGFISWPKKVEEVYWRCFKDVRSHIYWEFLIGVGEKMEKITKEAGLGESIEWKNFTPVPRWYPVPAHKADGQFDLYAFSWADATHVNTNTAEQPWIDEASNMNPFTYFVNMNADTAAQKGLKAGDRVEIESWRGLKVQGVLQVRKGQHPQTLNIMGVAGHWAKGLPIAKGKGVNFNSLIELRFSDLDPICGTLDPLVKVKVTRIS